MSPVSLVRHVLYRLSDRSLNDVLDAKSMLSIAGSQRPRLAPPRFFDDFSDLSALCYSYETIATHTTGFISFDLSFAE